MFLLKMLTTNVYREGCPHGLGGPLQHPRGWRLLPHISFVYTQRPQPAEVQAPIFSFPVVELLVLGDLRAGVPVVQALLGVFVHSWGKR